MQWTHCHLRMANGRVRELRINCYMRCFIGVNITPYLADATVRGRAELTRILANSHEMTRYVYGVAAAALH